MRIPGRLAASVRTVVFHPAAAAAAVRRMAALPALNWQLTAADITAAADAVIAASTAQLDAVAVSAPTWGAAIAPLVTMDRDLEARTSAVTFLKDVSTDKAVRDASTAACATLSAYEVAAGMRLDVFKAVKAYAEAAAQTAPAGTLDPEAARFVERTLRDFRRRGLDLPEATRKEVEALRTKISAIQVAFAQTLAEDDTKLAFSAEQLGGMPPDFIASLQPAEAAGAESGSSSTTTGLLTVTMAYPHVVPILKLCTVPATRSAVEKAFNSRAHPSNTKLLEELAELRRRAAGLLGYPSHAAFVLDERMAKDPATVAAFLSRLRADLAPLHASDLSVLKTLQTREEGAAAVLGMGDYRRMQEIDLQERYAVDGDALKAYFPLGTVLSGMFGIYETLLSVKFAKLAGPEVAAHVWHADVDVYEVLEDAEGASKGSRLGIFYLDMHPREGKYTHAAVFPLISGCESGPATPSPSFPAPARVMPVCAMVCNFTKPSEGAPSLLRHEEVVTLFHEFGHVMHHLLSRTRFHRFASFRVEQDFVEAPSQMLEVRGGRIER